MRNIAIVLLLMTLNGESTSCYYYMNGDKKIELTPISQEQSSLRTKEKVLRFMSSTGREIAIPGRLLVKFKSLQNLDKYLKRYNLTIIKRFQNGLYFLRAPSPQAALEAANTLNALPDVLYAQPDIIKKWKMR